MKQVVIAALLIVSVLLSGCNLPEPLPEETSVAPVVSPSSLPEEPTEPVDPPDSPALDTPEPGPCPMVTDPDRELVLDGTADLLNAITAFLNTGGSVDRARIAVRNWNNSQPEDIALAQEDVDGDGFEDILAALRMNAEMPLESRVFVLVCRGERYELEYLSPDLMGNRPAVIHTIQDFTGDGRVDALVLQESCGAHTCSVSPLLLTWHMNHIDNRWFETTDDLPTPYVQVVDGEDTLPVVLITATSIQSAGAGPLRSFTREYQWDSAAGAMTFIGETTLPATYRIHVVFDADQAFLDEEYEESLEAYARVIEDETLDDWMVGEDGYQRLSAYALFRSILTHLVRGENDLAGDAYHMLSESFTTGPGLPFAEMGAAFWDEYELSDSVADGCDAARAYAERNAEEIVDVLYYGYANPAYTVMDICPVTR